MADESEPQAAETEGKSRGGLALDIAGVIAAAVLVVIVIDIWSDGRISGRLAARRQQGQEVAADAGPEE